MHHSLKFELIKYAIFMRNGFEYIEIKRPYMTHYLTLWRYVCVLQIMFTQIAAISFLSWVMAIIYCFFYFIWFDLKNLKMILNKELCKIYSKSILELDWEQKTYRIISQNAVGFSFLPVFFFLFESSHVLNSINTRFQN